MEKKLWFKAKKYGWGWTPCTWQGWTVLGLYLLGIIPSAIHIDNGNNSMAELVYILPLVFILTVFLFIICYLTGEKPRWRWGN